MSVNIFKRCVYISLSILFLIFPVKAYAADRGPDANIPGEDYTIFRTVNTLSCHPQNPLLVNVPGWIAFNKTKSFNLANGVVGYCYAYHLEGNSNFIGKRVGTIGADGTGSRPSIPWRHYAVMEFPNPDYGKPNAKFSGRYIHWEGPWYIYIIGWGSGAGCTSSEIWHFGKEEVGGMSILRDNQIQFAGRTYTDNFGQSRCGGEMTLTGNFSWKTYAVTNPMRRPGDETTAGQLPLANVVYSLSRIVDEVPPLSGQTRGSVRLNPTFFTDIPHDLYGDLVGNDRSWTKCIPSGYIENFNSRTSPVYSVTPPGCDYPDLLGDPRLYPVCLSKTTYTAGVRIPPSLEGCVGTTPVTVTVIPPVEGDVTGDRMVTIADYNYVLTHYGASGLGDFNTNSAIDIFDYTYLIKRFGS